MWYTVIMLKQSNYINNFIQKYKVLILKHKTFILIWAVILAGVCLRTYYTNFTGIGIRTYDVYRSSWGHLDYIKYLAQNLSLPPVNDCQAYHPPVHHIIAAFALNQSRLFTSDEFWEFKYVQYSMTLLSSLTLFILYLILKELKCSKVAILAGVSLFAFHPSNIYFSSRINNDNTMFFFYTLAFFFLLKWLNSNLLRHIVLLAVTAALAALSKLSGFMLAPVIAAAFIIVLFKTRSKLKMFIKQFFIFSLIYLPLSMSYQIRNYILFKQEFGYVPAMDKGFTPTIYNLLHFSVGDMVLHPFNNGGLKGGEFFLEFFLKSSLFGEWQYPGLEPVAVPLLLLTMFLILVLFMYLLSLKTNIAANYRYLFLVNMLLPIILEMKFRTDYPVACSQDFRYAAPILISAAFFLGEAVNSLKQHNRKVLQYAVSICIAAFNVISIIFILSLRDYS